MVELDLAFDKVNVAVSSSRVTVSLSSIVAVPEAYYEGALALGATKERSIFKTVIPAAKSGVMSGIILGMGRAIGETMAVVMWEINLFNVACKVESALVMDFSM